MRLAGAQHGAEHQAVLQQDVDCAQSGQDAPAKAMIATCRLCVIRNADIAGRASSGCRSTSAVADRAEQLRETSASCAASLVTVAT